ncbi:hypothetical protein F5141DRAFT_1099278 [Pisolithus sp. B1]|nr:hypothetical protein F5141DRAFT_1099278 [Pisolithus sp. B1]
MHAQHDLPAADRYSIIKRPPSDLFHRLYDDHTTPVGLLYKALNVTEVEGRKLSSRVKSIIAESDFDLGKKLLDHTQRDMRRLEQLVLEEIPGFQRYEDCWPISVLVRRHLRHRTALTEYRARQRASREKIMDKKLGRCSQRRMGDAMVPLKKNYFESLLTKVAPGASSKDEPTAGKVFSVKEG